MSWNPFQCCLDPAAIRPRSPWIPSEGRGTGRKSYRMDGSLRSPSEQRTVSSAAAKKHSRLMRPIRAEARLRRMDASEVSAPSLSSRMGSTDRACSGRSQEQILDRSFPDPLRCIVSHPAAAPKNKPELLLQPSFVAGRLKRLLEHYAPDAKTAQRLEPSLALNRRPKHQPGDRDTARSSSENETGSDLKTPSVLRAERIGRSRGIAIARLLQHGKLHFEIRK